MQNTEGGMALSVTCGATSPKVRGKQGSHFGGAPRSGERVDHEVPEPAGETRGTIYGG